MFEFQVEIGPKKFFFIKTQLHLYCIRVLNMPKFGYKFIILSNFIGNFLKTQEYLFLLKVTEHMKLQLC